MRRDLTGRGFTLVLAGLAGLSVALPALADPAQSDQSQPAASQDHPPVMPTHDAAVTYEMTVRGKTQRIGVMFGGGGNLLRIDNPDSPGSLVFDKRASTLLVIMQQPKAYMDVPLKTGQQNPFMLDPGQQFRRLGSTRTIAGVTCNDWEVSSAKGKAVACVTDDGLLLAQSGADPAGVSGTMQAVSVSEAALPAGTFQAPPGFTRIAHPG